ncbi:hypothetical protein [Bacillus inaquosorum]|nr:hypothetical protein [Bacillus inaquosorum]WBL53579.1 hypothetical protein [Bacillus phage yong1]CAF1840838.1 hypothetical protein NRS6167_02201 [Bacillus subtilis]MDZ5541475.1 hypothetical protein [Bacillus inaquosorum]MEC0872379.1 hypothetical protein [Bacillus inaquosorum]MEC0956191.1 hypothetical protein [Bacillus inaquosorum]
MKKVILCLAALGALAAASYAGSNAHVAEKPVGTYMLLAEKPVGT